ncbi:MAG: S-methyl-5-thioribose-1-phosphate isomerase [Acidobacteria bacterium]|nr:MAG: S-methyl-5-thioribose-1-phosphate isomerase [Acidobacteriota bacterium]
MFKTIEWTDDGVRMIDQTRLPGEEVYFTCRSYRDVAHAIRSMVIRGAPAIGVAAAMGVALGVKDSTASSAAELRAEFETIAEAISKTRPTAVNLFWAIERMREVFERGLAGRSPDQSGGSPGGGFDAGGRTAPFMNATEADAIAAVKVRLIEEAQSILAEDIAANEAMGRHGAELLGDSASVLTHCNAGALATAGYGTALGVVRAAVAAGKKIEVFADETRPFLQGARLTAWELTKDGIPVTLITDNMAGHFMQGGKIQAVIVGADRIARNGDVANKIGTYTLAVLAHENKIPFYVAAPRSTIDFKIASGTEIPIEERSPREVTHWAGVATAPEHVRARHPAFDVTPHRYVTAIVTERGIAREPFTESLKSLFPPSKTR